MVLFIQTKDGWAEAQPLIKQAEAVWINPDVLTAEELAAMRQAGLDLTTFSEKVELAKQGALAAALATICEYHPGQRFWVEFNGSEVR